LIATPMASLLGDRNDSERETAIRDIAIEAEALLDKDMLRDGRLSFPCLRRIGRPLKLAGQSAVTRRRGLHGLGGEPP
jgi:hypothetical protein